MVHTQGSSLGFSGYQSGHELSDDFLAIQQKLVCQQLLGLDADRPVESMVRRPLTGGVEAVKLAALGFEVRQARAQVLFQRGLGDIVKHSVQRVAEAMLRLISAWAMLWLCVAWAMLRLHAGGGRARADAHHTGDQVIGEVIKRFAQSNQRRHAGAELTVGEARALAVVLVRQKVRSCCTHGICRIPQKPIRTSSQTRGRKAADSVWHGSIVFLCEEDNFALCLAVKHAGWAKLGKKLLQWAGVVPLSVTRVGQPRPAVVASLQCLCGKGVAVGHALHSGLALVSQRERQVAAETGPADHIKEL
eukprot:m.51852 g.51852  ORF g.51852 m.51852 type:complete len:304 (-) comp13024_c0_seq4:3557-4468(-)